MVQFSAQLVSVHNYLNCLLFIDHLSLMLEHKFFEKGDPIFFIALILACRKMIHYMYLLNMY